MLLCSRQLDYPSWIRGCLVNSYRSINRVLFRQVLASADSGWSSFPVMGAAFGNFFTGSAGDAVMAEWAAAATCDTRNLYMVEELHNTMEQ